MGARYFWGRVWKWEGGKKSLATLQKINSILRLAKRVLYMLI